MIPKLISFLFLFFDLIFYSKQQESNQQNFVWREMSHNDYDPKGWRNAAAYLRQTMNDRADPCDNFYEHVCGNYGTKNSSQTTAFLDMALSRKATLLAKTLIEAIEKIDLNKINTSRYERAIRVFYDQCISLESEPQWPKRLYEAISARLGELPIFLADSNKIEKEKSASRSWNLLGRIQREFGQGFMLTAMPIPLKAKVDAKLILVPTRIKEDDQFNMTVFNSTLEQLVSHVNNKTTDIESWIDRIVAFYKDWRNVTLDNEDEKFRIETISFANASLVIPNFDWKSYFDGLLPEDARQIFLSDANATIAVIFAEQLNKIGALFEKHDYETVRSLAFMEWYEHMEETYFGKMTETSFMLLTPKTPNERCLEFGLQHLSPAIAKLYFKWINADIVQWRQDIVMLGRNIFAAFRFLLNNVDWLDAGDKEKIQEKVDGISFYPGIPSWIGDENKVVSQITEFDSNLTIFENEFRAKKALFNKTMRRVFIKNENIDEEEELPSFKVNAQYNPDVGISLFLGLMVPPLYSTNYPLAVKYGGLGAVIGHELMHAFDAHNVYQGAYEGQEWLKESAFQEFERKKRCLVRQYSTYCYQDKGVCVRGDSTISDNIADIDGMKVAFTAFKFAQQVFGNDPPVPGMLNYTSDQLFFMTSARTWCSKGWTEMWEAGPYSHTPPKPRVEIMIRNVVVFAKAFGCKVGSKYAPLLRCSLWGDLANPAKWLEKRL